MTLIVTQFPAIRLNGATVAKTAAIFNRIAQTMRPYFDDVERALFVDDQFVIRRQSGIRSKAVDGSIFRIS